jgi:hypothetical protein
MTPLLKDFGLIICFFCPAVHEVSVGRTVVEFQKLFNLKLDVMLKRGTAINGISA